MKNNNEKIEYIYLLQVYYKLMKDTDNIYSFMYYKYKYNQYRETLKTKYNIYNVFKYVKML